MDYPPACVEPLKESGVGHGRVLAGVTSKSVHVSIVNAIDLPITIAVTFLGVLWGGRQKYLENYPLETGNLSPQINYLSSYATI